MRCGAVQRSIVAFHASQPAKLFWSGLPVDLEMAPRSAKRQRTGTGLGVQTTLDAAWDAEKLDDMMAMAQQVNPVAEPILTCITQKIEEHGGISHWIGSVTNSKDFQLSYARNLRSMFPPQASAQVTYLGASMEWPQSTLVGVQLWQLSWSEEDGFSMPSNDELLTMICAILNHGMRTNPAEHAGTEPLAVKMGKRQANGTQLTLFENSKGTEPVDGMVTVLPGVNIGGGGGRLCQGHEAVHGRPGHCHGCHDLGA